MRLSSLGTLILASLLAAAASSGAQAATTNYAVGNANCEGEVPLCNPAQHFSVTTDGALSAELVADAGNCTTIDVRFAVDGGPPTASESVPPGGGTGATALGPVAPGTHTLSLEVDVPITLGCDFRAWAGTLSVTTSGVAATDTAFAGPGDIVTVSTAVSGSPRPAGIAATYTRSGAAVGVAQISVTTYSGLPSGLPPDPIRAAAFLDLQLTNADADDTIAGEFLPPNPILPPNPVFPNDPLFPTDSTLPPNPVRLAWWDGSDWLPVLIPTDPISPPVYDSVLGRLTFDFTAASSPSVFQLSGTVFAVIPNYYFRGFGTPVDMGTLNVAKAGRAIPLKWQVFDENVAPVTGLDPEIVKVSSVAINCAASGSGADVIEEYATGQSGLQNLGDGVYQLNWSTSKSYAGTCRRLRLDLGERNPDGSTFYRTADFQFTR
jgi:hypothetical protein